MQNDQPEMSAGHVIELLGSERFAHFEDQEADVYFEAYELLRKEKRLQDKLWEGKLRRARRLSISREKVSVRLPNVVWLWLKDKE